MRHVIRAFEFILCLTLATGAGVASGQEPIKIGFISPLSGAIAQAGKDMYSGCEMFWEESGWQIGGRKLEVTLEDNEGVPATALTKARKLVESDRVHLLAGVILSNVAYALVPYIEAQGIPTIYPINSADDLTQRKRPKWLTRTGFSAGGNMHPFGEYAAKVLGYKKVVTVGLDPRARALPIATTGSPTATLDELAKVTVERPLTPWIWSNATSADGSVPMTVAV